MSRPLCLWGFFFVFGSIFSSNTVSATREKIWELAGHSELARGELQQTLLSSRGEITQGLGLEKIDLEAVGLVWSVLRHPDGTIYLGTGYDGKIFRLKGNKAHLIATIDAVVVTDMVFDKNGSLLVSGLPNPTIWKIPSPSTISPAKPAKASAFVTLDEKEQIWTIAMDSQHNKLYVGTGPEGTIWTVGADRKPHLYLKTEQQHILDIYAPGDDSIYVGTAPDAQLLKVTGPGKSFAIADFEGTEVKSIDRLNDGNLVVAVNKFTTPSKTIPKKLISLSSANKKSTSPKSSKGTGEIFIVSKDGTFESLYQNNSTHVVTVVGTKKGKIWAGLGNDGKIISIAPNRIVHEVANLDEREVMALVADTDLLFATTGDAGAAYRFNQTPVDSAYLTPVLDALNISHFGKIIWFAKGALRVSARCGNTVTPDQSWTDWSQSIENGTSPKLPAARYVQFKFRWLDAHASLHSVELSYRPKNRRAIITSFSPDSPFKDTKGASKGEAGTSERTILAKPSASNTQQRTLSWSVSNPDGDKIRYRLFYKPTNKSLWISIFREDYRFSSTRFTWPTSTIPEGRYHFKLTADDSMSNGAQDVLSDEYISVPVNIDNHPPVIKDLTFKKGMVRGTAQDSFSSIVAIYYSVDGGIWLPVAAKDDLFDNRKESFEFPVLPPLEPGGHMVTVRAYDRNGNFVVKEIHMEIAK